MPVYVNGELVLYGFVGESYWREGFTSREVLEALAEHGADRDLSVRINSGGGFAFEGLAIYNALHAHKGKVTVYVDAIAASAASAVAMAGDEIVMHAGSEMMIHDPSTITFGTVDDHAKAMNALEKLGSQMAAIYAARSDGDEDAVRQTMKEETWFTAEEAVAAGYADTAGEAKAKPIAAFDYQIYARAPERLVALAKEKNWSMCAALNRTAASAAPVSQKEKQMAEVPKADDKAADIGKAQADGAAGAKSRIKTIMSLPEAEGRAALANHIAFDTDMDAEAAKSMLLAAAQETTASDSSSTFDTADADAYEAKRLLASGQSQPVGQDRKPGIVLDFSRADVFASRRQTSKGV